jgi:ubiquinone/menaquinone biosynthesis C-methylase UbiE
MREALDKGTLRSVYDRVAGHYDLQHAILTAHSDQRGRRRVVEQAVGVGDQVLDCGAGTGSTALLAAERVGPTGRVTLLDASGGMLAVAGERAAAAGVAERFDFVVGDIFDLPFADGSFDTVLSTYSMCPLREPADGARELYRVVRQGGRIGIAHSTEPEGRLTRWLADKVEDLAWRFPTLSLGCRSVAVLPALQEAGGRLLLRERIGVPLWPFLVLFVEKPAA